MKIRENVPISELTTMRLGGPARFVIEVEKIEDIPKAYAFAKEKNLPVFILGGGANTIGHDEGFGGVLIKNAMKGIAIKDNFITAFGGEIWDDVVAFTCERNLTGIEALSKIPGSAGAAPVQNIGAYGQDVSDTFVSAEVYDTEDGKFKTLNKSDMGFSYRKSILNTTEKGRYFVISITLKLKPGAMSRPFYNSIERYIASTGATDFSPQGIRKIVSEIRGDKLPDPKEHASSGSFFKNVYLDEVGAKAAEGKGYPVYHGHDGLKINSGWLIEKAGFSGELIHGMRVNPKAALVLINESAKNYSDLAAARTEIANAVFNKFGYKLEQEPVEIEGVTHFLGDPQTSGFGGKKMRQDPHYKLLNGSELAGFIKERQSHEARGKHATLLIIRDSDNPVITKYVNLKIRYGEDIGVKVIDYLASSTDDIRKKILSANKDSNISGIILQLPILEKDKTDELTALIAPAKDVDGLSENGNFDSATATAINWLLAGYDIKLNTAKIAIVGRGKLVGAPLFKMFSSSGYNVSLFHRGDNLTKLKNYDIIITATGKPGIITNEMVRPGAVIVDAGTASEDGVLKGDVAEEVRARTDLTAITPKIGGVGPLTVTCLFEHVLKSADLSALKNN
ncbi:UDP-N-acetylmuramate dehydrogenase [Candidatus Saccharibacteria bacterium]|nr:UDP-N-acetylmuramate dehydrogenase [Candidatus Saccharibacteria bacterium]